MVFTGFHHIGLAVSDMERSLAFYREGLGGKVVDSFPMASTGETIYMVELAPGTVIELLPGGKADAEQSPRWKHIALATDDAQAAFDVLVQAGARVRSALNTVEREKHIRSNAFVFGPDDEIIEIFQVIVK